MSAAPLVSVVMGVYNGERYLAEAVDSILSQTFRDFEFILINDGSTDGTAAILERYRGSDARIKVHTQANRGHAASLNTGCALAVGRYIARLDADDIAFASRFQRQVDFLEQNPQVALVGGSIRIIDSSGRFLYTEFLPAQDAQIRDELARRCCIYHPTIMMRKAALDRIGGYRVPFEDAEDLDLFLRMSERYELANLPEPVGSYRVYSNQVGQRNLKRQVTRDVAARVSARLRRETGDDPFWQVDEVTPALLRRFGVTAEMINARVVETLIVRARQMQSADGPETARQLLDEALACAQVLPRRRQLAAQVLAEYGALYMSQGRAWRSLSYYGRAWRALPARSGASLRRKLHRLGTVLRLLTAGQLRPGLGARQ